nr:c-type cytochrome [Rhizomicrobium palustre]
MALGLISSLACAQQLDPKFIAGCQKCHGQGGDSVSPMFPRLNGQQAEYMSAQLKNFRDHKRDDTHARGYMWGNARVLDDKTIAQIAQYFAQQKPTGAQTGGALAAEGAQLYQSGDPSKGINPCQQCHGKAGEGAGVMPRIAGQHSAYFRMVMGAFRSGQRKSDVMSVVAKNLSDRQIEALSSYLSND